MSRSAEVNAPQDAVRELLDTARAGSAEDFGTLIAGLRDYLLLVANRELTPNVRAKISASDVVQETFIQAQRKIAAFEGGTTGELLAWLRGILLNKIQVAEQRYIGVQARDVRREVELNARSASAGREAALLDRHESPSRHAIIAERSAAVDEMLGRLPSEYERVLRLRYWEQLSLDEIAQQMNRSADAVQKLWFRAVERIKRELKRHGRP